MQTDLTFKLDIAALPIDYRKYIISFFKEALTKYDNYLYHKWYSNTSIKPFCFTVYLNNPVFEKDNIVLNNNNFTIHIKSDISKDMIKFYNALLLRQKEKIPFKLKNNSMILKKVKTNIIPEYHKNIALIKFDSPLVVRLHDKETNKDNYYHVDDKEFNEVLKLNIKNVLEKLNYTYQLDGFKLEKAETKKTIVKIYNGNVMASLGTFKLYGEPELINILNKIGLGSMRSSGFGYFRIIDRKE